MNPTPDDGLPMKERVPAFLALALATMMAVMDGTIMNVALPTMASELHASAASSIWVVGAFQLAVTIALLPAAALGDALGCRRVYFWGLILFTLASVGCALAPNLLALSLARVVQGIGAAGIMSLNITLLRMIFPKREIGKAIGWIIMVVSVSAAISPSLSTIILEYASWPWLFMINLPLGIVAVWMGLGRLVDPPRRKGAFDVPSALGCAIGLGLIVSSLDVAGHHGSKILAVMMMGVGILLAVWVIQRQKKLKTPFIQFFLIPKHHLTPIITANMLVFIAQGAAIIALPFLIQHGLGHSQGVTGLVMTPWPVMLGLSAGLAGSLADRHTPKIICAFGLIVFAIGLVALCFLNPSASPWDIAWRTFLCGLGLGAFSAPNSKVFMVAMPRESSGSMGGISSGARLLGQAFGATSVGMVFSMTATRTDFGLIAPKMALIVALVAVALALILTVFAHAGGIKHKLALKADN